MMETTNKRKTNGLRPYSVSRWNGQPFHPDYVWNEGNEYANEISKLPFTKDTEVIGYTEGRWVVRSSKSKMPVVIDYVAIHADNLPRRMNNLELFEWMLDRRGVKLTTTGWISMIHQYQEQDADKPVQQGVKVKPNGAEYFVEPTIDLL